ncbi:hypothetical protein EYF80_031549 [Liparis tanakae]|uniref:Uncharacterized protein n=1 Tax=Liparis tanakae TaxID=230148 RepID=A0A4Z2GX67_9TELE|nr:hypothetical protein EYF80_031549 [Liparis tanakae]
MSVSAYRASQQEYWEWEQYHKTEQHDSEERDKSHGGCDDEGLHIKRKWNRGPGHIGPFVAGLVGDEGKCLVWLVGPIGGVAMHKKVGRFGVVSRCIACDAQVGAVVLDLGVTDLQCALASNRKS